jgi:probable rRNA maturation factor
VISIRSSNGLPGLSAPLRAIVRGTLALQGARAGEIGVRLSFDPELRALNRRWRGIDRATDVLSFPYQDAAAQAISGDLVISMDRAVEQARRYRVSLGRELARLVIHGTLHLAGHDHHRAGERLRMREAESRAMRETRASIRALDLAWERAR